MVSERDVFGISGPVHLTSVNWDSPHHRRSVAASLVQGVYVLECDRQQNHQGTEALAPPWWEFFHFELVRQLVDDADASIFGAIYEFKPPPYSQHSSASDAPKLVIAFRGTITRKECFSRDLALDLHLIRNCLHQTSRFDIAMQAVRSVVSAVGTSNIWLTGHSLGSAMAMLTGKNMAKVGILLETFLFNPPFLSVPIERIKDEGVKQGIRIASSLITAGLTVALKGTREMPTAEDPFGILSSWIPYLFVNPGDHICSEYIGYFEHRRNMEEIGAGRIERLATQNSIGGLLLMAFGKESEPLHLVPSANLTVNLSPYPDFLQAHGIHQWWRPDQHLKSKLYLYG